MNQRQSLFGDASLIKIYTTTKLIWLKVGYEGRLDGIVCFKDRDMSKVVMLDFTFDNFPSAKSTSGLAVDGDLHLMQDNMTRFCSEIQIYHYPRAAICVFGELFWDLLH